MNFIIFFITIIVINICAGDGDMFSSDDDEIDSILANILNSDYDAVGYSEENNEVYIKEEQPKLLDGIWICGNCSNIDESRILFTETLDLDMNYNDDENFELQVGLSVNNMRCIKIEAGAIHVRRVAGACAGEDVTLSIVHRSHIDVKIYG